MSEGLEAQGKKEECAGGRKRTILNIFNIQAFRGKIKRKLAEE